MNDKTRRIVEQVDKLKAGFEDLRLAARVRGDDGICISDVEFTPHEFRSILENFDYLLHSKNLPVFEVFVHECLILRKN